MDIAFFNYMEECEKKQTLNNRSSVFKKGLIGADTTQKVEEETENQYPDKDPPHRSEQLQVQGQKRLIVNEQKISIIGR